jgi:UDP-glucose 4-epimerase
MTKILVTGGAGFIGSHLVDSLLQDGHDVFVIDDLSTGQLANVEHLRSHPRFHLVVDTIMHHATVNELVHKCDIVFHLAAAVGVRLIVERPAHTLSTNVRGTDIVMELCARFNRRVLIASTSEVYGDRGEKVAFRENDRRVYGPTTVNRWAYAASKEVDEFLALAYNRELGVEVVIARLFNTIGPRQTGHYGMVVPRFVASALAGEPIQVYGDGSQTRCFLDVADCVRALKRLMDEPSATGAIFNVGSDRSIEIQELAELVRARAESGSPIVNVPYSEIYGADFEDMMHRRPSTEKIHNAIGWSAEISLEETVDTVIAQQRALSGEAFVPATW